MSFAIIDAAIGGEAKRCGCLRRSRYTTPIANLPLIYHVLDELAASGVNRARVVAMPAVREELERVLGGGRTWGVELSYADAANSAGREAVLTEIERVAAEEPVLVHPGDCLAPGQLSGMWKRFSAGDVDVIALGPGAPTAGRGTNVPGRPSTRVCDAPTIVGCRAVPAIGELLRSETADQDLVEWLHASDCRVAACEVAGHWRYSDSTEDLLIANRMVLDSLSVPAVDGRFGDNNEAHGRMAISPTAQISGCTLHGPVAVDEGAVVEDSFVGPYTAIAAGAVISGTDIDNAMVLAGAEVRHPGHRIEASIIGERASIVRTFELPKGLHLRLEPHSRVTLS